MEGPRFIDAARTASLLSYTDLIDHLRLAFKHADAISAPSRLHYTLPLPCSSLPSSSSSSSSSPSSSSSSSSSPALLLMPAWPALPSPSSSYMGVKLVAVFPYNVSQDLPSVSASYVLSSALTGLPLAFLDGKELTLWRTACVSALASRYLARSDARIMLMIGAGSLAPHLIKAHCAARPSVCTILVWNRTHSKAEALAESLQAELNVLKRGKQQADDDDAASSMTVTACTDLEKSVRIADLVCCATLSEQPLVQGSWLRPGTHLDLVGSFTPKMRECDDGAITQAAVFVDTPAALQEAGELAGKVDIAIGTLSDLVRGEKHGREHADAFTVFKSVGCALVDLATAQFIYERLHNGR